MKIQGLLFLFLSIIMFSCKMDKTSLSTTDTDVKELEAYAMLNQQDLKPEEIAAMRLAALQILDHRQKESANKSYTIIDKDIWQYDATVINSDMKSGDSLEGRWIDFKEDLTFEYGRYDKKDGKGRYFYNLEDSSLLMVDDNEVLKPQEFDVKALNEMIVIVGRYVYKDNNIQSKLLRIPNYPAKK